MWELFRCKLQKLRNEDISHNEGEPNVDRAMKSIFGSPYVSLRGVQKFKASANIGEVPLSCRSEANRPSGTVKKLHMEMMLKQLDLPTQGRLGYIQPFCRASEMKFLCNNDKRTQLIDRVTHTSNSIVFNK
ncbi:hypothetical protein GCM10025778_35120 [Paeniglutamicibacter antarcticus]|uniref:Uncharacterized protein n=1 Tax=Paeniglutamicibacter antarcticus TaxID=494023 RepID=A0ABP9TT94_9MICC